MNQRDDTGASMVIAIVVMTILGSLTMALMARTLAVMSSVRNGQDFDAALAVADAGLADALFQIDQGILVDFPGNGTVASGSFSYWADRISDTQFVVTSLGTVGRSRHAIQAVVTRGTRFPYALWSNQPLHFDGNILSPAMRIQFYAFNRLPGDPDWVRIGSNAQVLCNGPVDPHVYIDEYAGHGDCETDHLTKLAEPRDLSYSAPTGMTQPCPAGGVFGVLGTTSANPAIIDGAGGPFVCRENVTLTGFIGVQNGPVQIYILPTVDAAGNVVAEYSLDMSTAIVNQLSPASQFQIYKSGAAPINLSAANLAGTMTFRGVLWAPESRLTVNGGLWWTGSINVNELVVNGSPNLTFGYDWDLGTYLGKDWKVGRYREMAAAPAAAIINGGATTTTSTQPPASSTTTLLPLPTLPEATTTTIELPTTTSTQPPTSTTTTAPAPTTTTTLLPPLPTTLPPLFG